MKTSTPSTTCHREGTEAISGRGGIVRRMKTTLTQESVFRVATKQSPGGVETIAWRGPVLSGAGFFGRCRLRRPSGDLRRSQNGTKRRAQNDRRRRAGNGKVELAVADRVESTYLRDCTLTQRTKCQPKQTASLSLGVLGCLTSTLEPVLLTFLYP